MTPATNTPRAPPTRTVEAELEWATRPPLSELLPLELAADEEAAGAAEKPPAADVAIGEGVKTTAGVVVVAVGVAMTLGVTTTPGVVVVAAVLPSIPPETGRPREAQPEEYSTPRASVDGTYAEAHSILTIPSGFELVAKGCIFPQAAVSASREFRGETRSAQAGGVHTASLWQGKTSKGENSGIETRRLHALTETSFCTGVQVATQAVATCLERRAEDA